MQNILFIIDELELKYFEFNDLVTNHWLIKEFLDRGYKVCISTKNRLLIENAKGTALYFDSFAKNGDIFYEKIEKKGLINDFDVVFFRPDPPVDVNYINACYVFDFVDKERTLLINDPCAVRNFNEKLHLNYFPQYAPENIVTSSKEEIKSFVNKVQNAIIKPLNRCLAAEYTFFTQATRILIQSSLRSQKTEKQRLWCKNTSTKPSTATKEC